MTKGPAKSLPSWMLLWHFALRTACLAALLASWLACWAALGLLGLLGC